ncbi:MAG: Kae1-associated serine/threonine protein kinase [Candidatus Aenigmarchaeota archaeon]|nr:Kae1-associated serine/threonine protein kinase [Candidatus Aenigmarchaeota archaeon]
MNILKRGAEALLTLEEKDGRPAVLKQRLAKGYRQPELDQRLRKLRTRNEARMLGQARRAGLDVPAVMADDDYRIWLERIAGRTLKETLAGLGKQERLSAYGFMASAVAKLHAVGIVHGDLTTSNMILAGGKLWLLDFGLAKSSRKAEDQATDLYLLLEAVRASHHSLYAEAAPRLLNAYRDNYEQANAVINRLAEIEKRRRYKAKADA